MTIRSCKLGHVARKLSPGIEWCAVCGSYRRLAKLEAPREWSRWVPCGVDRLRPSKPPSSPPPAADTKQVEMFTSIVTTLEIAEMFRGELERADETTRARMTESLKRQVRQLNAAADPNEPTPITCARALRIVKDH
jgi:hypothetical protein